MQKLLSQLTKKQIQIRQFCSINDRIFNEGTELCKLAFLGDLERLKHFVEVENYNVNSYDADFRTALHLAAAENRLDIVKYLIDKGALLLQDTFGNIPIHDAKFSLNPEIVQLLNQVPIKQQDKFNNEHQRLSQMRSVLDLIQKTGVFNFGLIHNQINYFYNDLHMHDLYFQILDHQYIQRHILSQMMAQQVENIAQKNQGLYMASEQNDQPFYICSTQNINKAFIKVNENLKKINVKKAVQVQIHSSHGVYQLDQKQQLEIFQIIHDDYISQNPNGKVQEICQKQFLKNPVEIQEQYDVIIQKTLQDQKPQFEVFVHEKQTIVLISNHFRDYDPKENIQVYHSANIQKLSLSFQELGLNCHYKVMDTFSNGVRVCAFHMQKQPSQEQLQLLKQQTTILNITKDLLINQFINHNVKALEFLYLDSVYNFAKFFLDMKNEDLDYLVNVLESDINQLTKLDSLDPKNGQNLKQKIDDIIENNISLIKNLYIHFQNRLNKKDSKDEHDSLLAQIKQCKDPFHQSFLRTTLMFNDSIMKTNFNTIEKSAIIYQLNPQKFLKNMYKINSNTTVIMLKSRDYQGLQVNLGNVSRGNVQIIKNQPFFKGNVKSTFFNDTYREALKQHDLNMNLPESGFQANLILYEGRNQFIDFVYKSYIQTIGQILYNEEGVTDLNNIEQIQFISNLKIDDKSVISNQQKNHIYLKNLQNSSKFVQLDQKETNFSERSIREFLRGIQRHENKKPEETTAFVIGGPTGNLAHSYLKVEAEKIVGCLDQTGIIYDPKGLDKSAMKKLIDNRLSISDYNGPISEQGFQYSVKDENITISSGKFFTTGLQLRNNLHLLNIQADFLVVLGGSKNSINLEQSKHLVNENICKFKTIIEASDSYLSINAVEHMVANGVKVFQSQSTQLGPVTSSSLEFLLYVSLHEKEYQELVTKKKGKYSKQFQAYLEEVGERISHDSRKEFEHQYSLQKKGKKVIVGDQISQKVLNLQRMIFDSNLFENNTLREKVFNQYVPNTLKEIVSYDELVKRIPLPYQKQMFSNHIANQFYETCGDVNNVYQFYNYMKNYEQE